MEAEVPFVFRNNSMFTYTACGLTIDSFLPLPELTPSVGESRPDVTIREGKVDWHSSELNGSNIHLRAEPQEVRLFWKDVGSFLVREGHQVFVEPASDDQVLRLFLLGRVFATVLHQRGMLVLHASAVAQEGSAIAFLGGKGWGKSTLAGAFYKAGYSLVSDDVVAVGTDNSQAPIVYPGFPQLKLWPEAAASLGDEVESLPRLHPSYEKRARRAVRGFSGSPVPLKHLYVLDEGDRGEAERLHPTEAFRELIRHSYLAKLLEPTETAPRHFRQCEKIVNSVPISRLRKPDSLATLGDIVALVREDIGDLMSCASLTAET